MSDNPRQRVGDAAAVARDQLQFVAKRVRYLRSVLARAEEACDYWSKRETALTALQAFMDAGGPVRLCRGESYGDGEYSGCPHGDGRATADTKLNCPTCYGSGWAEDVEEDA